MPAAMQNPNAPDLSALVATVGNAQPDVYRLARLLALAARVERPLVRLMRLRLLPGSASEVEADLYFSRLVRSYSATTLELEPSVVSALREELRHDPSTRTAARRILRAAHRDAPAILRLEELVIFLSLCPGSETLRVQRRLQRLLRAVAVAMVDQDRSGLALWAQAALPELPEEARKLEEIRMLGFGTRVRLNDQPVVEGDIPVGQGSIPAWVEWMLPKGRRRVTWIGVRRFGSQIELSQPPAQGADFLEVPDLAPALVEVYSRESGDGVVCAVHPGESLRIKIGTGPIHLRTVTGDVYVLPAEARALPEELTSRALREKILKTFPTSIDFQAFVLDHFPQVARQFFSDSMAYVQKVNILLERTPLDELFFTLNKYDIDRERMIFKPMLPPTLTSAILRRLLHKHIGNIKELNTILRSAFQGEIDKDGSFAEMDSFSSSVEQILHRLIETKDAAEIFHKFNKARPAMTLELQLPGSTQNVAHGPLRALLREKLKTESDFDAFCLDHFRNKYRQFTNGMSRSQKEAVLVHIEYPALILLRLLDQDPKSLSRYEELVVAEHRVSERSPAAVLQPVALWKLLRTILKDVDALKAFIAGHFPAVLAQVPATQDWLVLAAALLEAVPPVAVQDTLRSSFPTDFDEPARRLLTLPESWPLRRALRTSITNLLPRYEDFYSFCVDEFPDLARKIGSDLDRAGQLNLLLSVYSPIEIIRSLKARHPDYSEELQPIELPYKILKDRLRQSGFSIEQPWQRAAIRRLLRDILPGESSFIAFCMDFFPEVEEDFAYGYDRINNENKLFLLCHGEDIVIYLSWLFSGGIEELLSEATESVDKHEVDSSQGSIGRSLLRGMIFNIWEKYNTKDRTENFEGVLERLFPIFYREVFTSSMSAFTIVNHLLWRVKSEKILEQLRHAFPVWVEQFLESHLPETEAVPEVARPVRPAELRRLLQAAMPTDADLDAFCMDYFPEVFFRFSRRMDRQSKDNILLEEESPAALMAQLAKRFPQQVQAFEKQEATLSVDADLASSTDGMLDAKPAVGEELTVEWQRGHAQLSELRKTLGSVCERLGALHQRRAYESTPLIRLQLDQEIAVTETAQSDLALRIDEYEKFLRGLTLHNLPAPRDPEWVERDEEQADFHLALLNERQELATRGEPSPVCCSCTGLPGIGKTQFTLEYAHRFLGDFYQTVVWIDGSGQDLRNAIVRAARELNLVEAGQPTDEQLLAALHHHLAHDGPHLVIFDNVDFPASIGRYLPRRGDVCVIIISRQRDIPFARFNYRLEVLTEERARQLLRGKTPLSDPREEQAAAELCRELGYLPLALRLVSRVYRARVRSMRELRASIRDVGLMKWRSGSNKDLFVHSSLNLSALFETSFERLDPVSRTLASAAGYFAAAPIERGLLCNAAARLAGRPLSSSEDEHQWLMALENLDRAGLIEHSVEQTVHSGISLGVAWIRMHPLLQEYLRSVTADEDAARRAVCEALARMVQQTPLFGDSRRELRRHLPHMRAMLPYLEGDDKADWPARYLVVLGIGRDHCLMGEYSIGLALCDQFLPTSLPPSAAAEVMNLRHQRASALSDLLRFDAALADYQQVLQWRRENLGEEHLETSFPLHEIGIIHLREKRFAEAEEIFASIRDIAERRIAQLGRQTTATNEHRMWRISRALALTDLGRAAIGAARAAVSPTRLGEAQLGATENLLNTIAYAHVLYAETMEALAELGLRDDVFAAGPLLAEADALCLQAMQESESAAPHNLLSKAEEKARQVLAIREREFGTEHPSLIEVYECLAQIALAQGDPKQAQQASERASALSHGRARPSLPG